MTIPALKNAIRDIPDFPKEGIIFKDITPLLAEPSLFKLAVDTLAGRHRDSRIDRVCVVESRGFLFGSAVAYQLGAGLVPIRKKGKLPHETLEAAYDLEYGTATLQVHVDAFEPGTRVLLIDDLLATGGTAEASARLIEQLGGKLIEIQFLIELAFLNGREKLTKYPVFAPIVYD
ncbi:MAG TPA: adenine phosphoribosyltransferase [Kiritimatiellia bacterium]|nr:adenine phosphoribosyltransferase [Kiritimatiellia bacterium]HRZ12858.1 adenine phosphoribosyltransferase [Kiritimatiellia bacterium]HSA18190.1 adenine phosphoribosyltransferase [Kiritimatiellia bacterium]